LGRVKFYSAPKGFGFIEAEDGQEYFVHVSVLESCGILALAAGERVAFVIDEEKGRRSVFSLRPIPDSREFET
jgi:CspA family cold shock protein